MTGYQPRQPAGHGSSGKRKASETDASERGRADGPVRPDQAPRPLGRSSIPPTQSLSGTGNPQSPGAKLPIPRLQKASEASSSRGRDSPEKNRVNHACEPCRQRKTKCSGERPACKHCQDFRIQCVYADGKRDRAKKEFDQMERKLAVYEQLLFEAGPHLDPSSWSRFQAVMTRNEDEDEDGEDEEISGISLARRTRSQERSLGGLRGEIVRSTSLGSIGGVDKVEEDITRSSKSRATGFIGKISEIEWIKGLQDKTQGMSAAALPDHIGAEGGSLSHASYNIDNDENLLGLDDVDALAIPSLAVASSLLETYFDAVHTSYPFIGKLNFRHQMQQFFRADPTRQRRPNVKWLAVMNLVFALAARYKQLSQEDVVDEEQDHCVFFARARLLGLDGQTLFDQPDLQRVQILALTAFYLMTINQINRSWTFCGLALRTAIALALHVEIDNEAPSEPLKELRYRLWWAIYMLDRTLEVMTGRPSPIVSTAFSTPLPLPYDEEDIFDERGALPEQGTSRSMVRFTQSSYRWPAMDGQGLAQGGVASPQEQDPREDPFDVLRGATPTHAMFLIYSARLSLLIHEVTESLYQPASVRQLWSQVQLTIAAFNKHLDDWLAEIPDALNFTKPRQDTKFARQRITLGFFYFNVCMIANRPCLCVREDSRPRESDKSRMFNRQAAVHCVVGARGMLELLPDVPDPLSIYGATPWWCLIHHLTQAVTVLTIELFYECSHMPDSREAVLNSAKKGLCWLHQMAWRNETAARAWALTNKTFRNVAENIGLDVGDLYSHVPSHSPSTLDSMPAEFGLPDEIFQQSYSQTYYGHMYSTYAPLPGIMSPSPTANAMQMFPHDSIQPWGMQDLQMQQDGIDGDYSEERF